MLFSLLRSLCPTSCCKVIRWYRIHTFFFLWKQTKVYHNQSVQNPHIVILNFFDSMTVFMCTLWRQIIVLFIVTGNVNLLIKAFPWQIFFCSNWTSHFLSQYFSCRKVTFLWVRCLTKKMQQVCILYCVMLLSSQLCFLIFLTEKD